MTQVCVPHNCSTHTCILEGHYLQRVTAKVAERIAEKLRSELSKSCGITCLIHYFFNNFAAALNSTDYG